MRLGTDRWRATLGIDAARERVGRRRRLGAGRRSRVRLAAATVLGGGALVVGLALVAAEPAERVPSADDAAPEAVADPAADDVGAPDVRVGPTQAVVVEPDGYEPLEIQDDGSPVWWSSCQPVRYVVGGDAPRGSTEVLAAAVAKIEKATGLDLVSEGRTTEVTSAVRPSWQPERYGERYAPVLISWTDAKESPDLADLAGYALPVSMPNDDGSTLVFTTGTVALDRDYVEDELTSYGEEGRAEAVSLVMHELGHLMGLDHVEERDQVMHDRTFGLTRWGDGDRRGLKAAGSGRCTQP